MATKSGGKGRYICKVGFYDVYAKDTIKTGANGKTKSYCNGVCGLSF